jgi:hypothetical protein
MRSQAARANERDSTRDKRHEQQADEHEKRGWFLGVVCPAVDPGFLSTSTQNDQNPKNLEKKVGRVKRCKNRGLIRPTSKKLSKMQSSRSPGIDENRHKL